MKIMFVLFSQKKISEKISFGYATHTGLYSKNKNYKCKHLTRQAMYV